MTISILDHLRQNVRGRLIALGVKLEGADLAAAVDYWVGRLERHAQEKICSFLIWPTDFDDEIRNEISQPDNLEEQDHSQP